jgi:protein-S-isoprenylcysteine O-methyltransferase Ste14
LFGLFLLLGSLHLVDLSLDRVQTLLLDATLSLAFFIQHSVMVRAGFRRRLSRFVSSELHGAVYSIVSGLFLVALVVLWQEAEGALFNVQGVMRGISRGLFLVALVGFAWGARALGPFDTLGLQAIKQHLRGKAPRQVAFVVRGPYRWVRHPLYLFTLVLLWSCPDPTADRLLFNVLFTGWIVVGTILEERDLVAVLGQQYRDYQRRVPMLLPYRLRPVGNPEQH